MDLVQGQLARQTRFLLVVVNDYVLEQVETQYDANSLPQLTTRRRRFHDETATGELANKDTAPKARVSYVGRFYDKDDRPTAVVDVGTNGGSAYPWNFSSVPARTDTVLVTDFQYHAAGWPELVADPRALVRKTTYDNLGRTTRVVENFSGSGTPTNTTNRTTEFTYDGNGNKLTHKAVLPASGQQTTGYNYQARTTDGHDINSNDLLTFVNHPDKTTGEPSSDPTNVEFFLYNGVGQQKKARYDRNESVHAYTYDVVGRLLVDAIDEVGPGVDAAVRRLELSHDDAGRRYRFSSFAAVSGGTALNQVEQRFNGFGQLISEAQEHGGAVVSGSPKVQYGYSYDPSLASGPNHSRPASFTYPVSTPYPAGRAFTYDYATGLDDRVSRLSAIKEGLTTLEGYTYLGLGTVVERTHPQPNVNLTYIDPAGGSGSAGDKYIGLDSFDRIVDVHWRNPSTSTTTDRFQYGYDRNGNRLYRDNAHPDVAAALFDELYHLNGASQGYDGFNQLLAFSRGTLNGAKDTIAAPTHYQKWTNALDESTLDALGNWTSVNTDGVTQTRGHNAQNQITSITAPDVTPDYDNNGNTKKDEKGRGLVYDAWDRLVEIKTSPTGTRIVRYSYDALGRRVKDETAVVKDFYYSKDWQVVEERHAGAVKMHYVWSPVYVDAMVLRDRNNDASTDLEERLYVQHDANYNVTAVVSAAGSVTERFVYDPFGKPTFLSAVWVPLAGGGLVAWQYLHQDGRYHDFGDGTGLYHFRRRDLSSSLGRWEKPDPTGFLARDNNLYRYVGNRPSVFVDPLGLDGSLGPGGFGLDPGGPVRPDPFLRVGGLYGANLNFTCCNKDERITLKQAVYDACACVHKALYALDHYWHTIQQSFGDPSIRLLFEGDNRQVFRDRLEKVYQGCSSGTINVSCYSNIKCTFGGMKAWVAVGGNTIHPCSSFYKEAADDRAETIWHEFGRVFLQDVLTQEATLTMSDVYHWDHVISILCRSYERIEQRATFVGPAMPENRD